MKNKQQKEEVIKEFLEEMQDEFAEGNMIHGQSGTLKTTWGNMKHWVRENLTKTLDQVYQQGMADERGKIMRSIKGQPCKEDCQILKDRILKSLTSRNNINQGE